MKYILRKKLSHLLLPLGLVLFGACGGGGGYGGGGGGNTPQAEQPVPTNEEENLAPVSFTQNCRKVDEVAGGNLQFDLAMPLPGEISRLSFNTGQNRARVETQGSSDSQQFTYAPVSPPDGEVGLTGQFQFSDLVLSFPAVPPGNIRGSTRELLIGNLTRGQTAMGTFLCSESLAREFN